VETNSPKDRLDEATSRRLSQLRSMPVDLSALTRRIEASIPKPATHRRLHLSRWLRPMRAVAASVLVMGLIGALIVASSTGPALASADALAQIHQEAVGMSHESSVNTIDAANAILAQKAPGNPTMPAMPDHPIMSCCVHQLGRKMLSCVTLEVTNTPVTIAVARASDVKCPMSETIQRDGVTYSVQSSGKTTMVMTSRDQKWLCVMGDLPREQLLDVASKLKF